MKIIVVYMGNKFDIKLYIQTLFDLGVRYEILYKVRNEI